MKILLNDLLFTRLRSHNAAIPFLSLFFFSPSKLKKSLDRRSEAPLLTKKFVSLKTGHKIFSYSISFDLLFVFLFGSSILEKGVLSITPMLSINQAVFFFPFFFLISYFLFLISHFSFLISYFSCSIPFSFTFFFYSFFYYFFFRSKITRQIRTF